ncbi:Glu/Leu/Phe/Val dehydrogenase family protein [Roseitalea porphyridii]|uniref:Glu/Leu/Phe/Val dehydrogenase family protein n=1 Tax=Roseitalea porphyridii TaxID=1852022 RepID=A0A4P6V4Z0_9HYPH|nr:Glu/Leu/Phe/Val dehydrogenase family protein [Roseitalea porphyridii]QBK31859.1 Glu/Leu/Phe/Val dehydrogenase family protein [Roseitalea porphyridii]
MIAPSEHPDFDAHAAVCFLHDARTGARAIVALHRVDPTGTHPSVGGCRMRDYETTEEALGDVLRLSRGMSSKCAVTGLPFGGAKAVVLGVPKPAARPCVLDAVAGFVNSFGGRFRTGVDVGLSASDVEAMRTATPWMVGTGLIRPDALTADGVFATLKRAVRHRLGRDDLGGTTVGVQGLGKVGLRLARLLLDDGARVLGGDVDRAANEEAAGMGVEIVDPASLIGLDIEVFAPCALGGVIGPDTVGAIRASVIAGSANNQLATADLGDALHAKGIFYVPDYLANAGGLIAVAMQIEGHDEAWAHSRAAGLADRLDEIVATARSLDISIAAAAGRLAAERLAS